MLLISYRVRIQHYFFCISVCIQMRRCVLIQQHYVQMVSQLNPGARSAFGPAASFL